MDLNRKWNNPNKLLHPTIYQARELIKNWSDGENPLCFFCDLHGHSKHKNTFIYGNCNPTVPEETRLFPLILSKLCPYFSFNSCRFGYQKSKENTARIALHQLLGVSSIYTLEASFCSCKEGAYKGILFTTDVLKQVGKDLCKALIPSHGINVPVKLSKRINISPADNYNHNFNNPSIPNTSSANLNLNEKSTILEGGNIDTGKHTNALRPKVATISPKAARTNHFMYIYTYIYIYIYRKGELIDGEDLMKNLLEELKEMDFGNMPLDEDYGSDDCPSEDNLTKKEMSKILPKTISPSKNNI